MRLAAHGFVTEVFDCQARGLPAQRWKIESFLRQNKVFCSLLFSVSRGLQQWFAAQSIPVLLLGTCHDSVCLPSLDLDFRSVCRHAGSVLLGKGHRRIALVVPDTGLAGTLASEQGFLAAATWRPEKDDICPIIVRHNGTVENLSIKLDALFRSAPVPTALIVAQTRHIFNVITYLLMHDISIPHRVSLIARDHDNIFADFRPALAHYYFNQNMFYNVLTRLMLKMASDGNLPPKSTFILPHFFAGGTVRRLN